MNFHHTTFPGLLSKDAFPDLTICIAGYYEKALGHYCKRPVVSEYQVAYCTAGKGVIRCAGKEAVIQKGDVLINIPGHPHEYWADGKEPWSHYWVHFTGTAAARYFQYLRCRPDEPGFSLGYNERLVGLYREMLDVLPHDDPPHQLQALSLLHGILSLMAVLRQQAETLEKPRRAGTQLDMAAVDLFMAEHPENITLPRFARSFALSVPHFIRLFEQKTGYSPMQYVARKKVTQSCRILVQSPALSIKEVAGRVGVEDPHYFSRLFKKVTGMTPQQYRQMSIR